MTNHSIPEILTVDEKIRLLSSQQEQAQQYTVDASKNNINANHAYPTTGSRISYSTLPLVVVESFDSHASDSSMLSRGWSAYTGHLETWPLLIKSTTAFFLLALADACAQGCERLSAGTDEQQQQPFDWLRMARFGVFGLLGAPWSHYYFELLDYVLPPTDTPCSFTTFGKLFIDQFIQAPILLAIIILVLHVMEGQGFSTMKTDLQNHYWKSLVSNCKKSTVYRRCICSRTGLISNSLSFSLTLSLIVLLCCVNSGKLWIPASFVNLAFVKPNLRVLFENVVFFVWTIILSFILHHHG